MNLLSVHFGVYIYMTFWCYVFVIFFDTQHEKCVLRLHIVGVRACAISFDVICFCALGPRSLQCVDPSTPALRVRGGNTYF